MEEPKKPMTEEQALHKMLSSIVDCTVQTIDALDEMILALMSSHTKMVMQIVEYRSKEGSLSSDSLDVNNVLADIESSEAFRDYAQKRWHFQNELQCLDQIRQIITGEPRASGEAYIEAIRKVWQEKLKKDF